MRVTVEIDLVIADIELDAVVVETEIAPDKAAANGKQLVLQHRQIVDLQLHASGRFHRQRVRKQLQQLRNRVIDLAAAYFAVAVQNIVGHADITLVVDDVVADLEFGNTGWQVTIFNTAHRKVVDPDLRRTALQHRTVHAGKLYVGRQLDVRQHLLHRQVEQQRDRQAQDKEQR